VTTSSTGASADSQAAAPLRTTGAGTWAATASAPRSRFNRFGWSAHT
jgi:hypothetical protein